jgi:hypothetical protein
MRNAILVAARDEWDPYDARDCALNLQFACADGLALAGESVPAEWEYRPSPFLAGYADDDGGTDYMTREYDYIGEVIADAIASGDADAVRQAGDAVRMLVIVLDGREGQS